MEWDARGRLGRTDKSGMLGIVWDVRGTLGIVWDVQARAIFDLTAPIYSNEVAPAPHKGLAVQRRASRNGYGLKSDGSDLHPVKRFRRVPTTTAQFRPAEAW
jgi:hypothetical protein